MFWSDKDGGRMGKVLIIGAGASGMTAAVTAARRGHKVTLVDCNDRVGKKILATGNGKCNFTNAIMSPDCFRSENPEIAGRILSGFGTKETLRFLGGLGIEPAVKNGYYYPASGQASSVVSVFEMELKHLGVSLMLGQKASDIKRTENGFSVTVGETTVGADSVILSCGSKAGISPQKAAGGYELAQKMGHSLTMMVPGLTGIRCRGNFRSEWSGVRTEGRITVRLQNGKRNPILATDVGELQLTDYGVSGIPAFQVSRFAAMALAGRKRVIVELDFFPHVSQKELEEMLSGRQKRMRYKSAEEMLIGLLPDKLIRVFRKQAGDSPQALAACMKSFVLEVAEVNPIHQAQVCAGGVRLTEIQEETMESRIIPGLYLTGEMLDAEGICGGYNLQWAWATGTLAGKSVLK